MKRIKELDTELLELIRRNSKQVTGIDRIKAVTILRQRYGLSISEAMLYTNDLAEIAYKEKFGEDKPQ